MVKFASFSGDDEIEKVLLMVDQDLNDKPTPHPVENTHTINSNRKSYGKRKIIDSSERLVKRNLRG